jgi:hypothetical protein
MSHHKPPVPCVKLPNQKTRRAAVGLLLLMPLFTLWECCGILPTYFSEDSLDRWAATFALGFCVFKFTSSCLPILPCLWIGASDSRALGVLCASSLCITLLTLVWIAWCLLSFPAGSWPEQSQLEQLPTVALSMSGCLTLIFACLLVAWFLARKGSGAASGSLALFVLHCAGCLLAAASSYTWLMGIRTQ